MSGIVFITYNLESPWAIVRPERVLVPVDLEILVVQLDLLDRCSLWLLRLPCSLVVQEHQFRLGSLWNLEPLWHHLQVQRDLVPLLALVHHVGLEVLDILVDLLLPDFQVILLHLSDL